MKRIPVLAAAGLLGVAFTLTACGGSSSDSGGGSNGGGSSSGKWDGMQVAVLLPDTKSSARYLTQDEPNFRKFFKSQGMTEGENFTIQNAKGDPNAMRTDADQAIQKGAKVLIVDGIDTGSAAAIEKAAKSKGVATIDYDRLTLEGDASYYVSFDNTEVGKLQGQGLVDCIKKWGVSDPHVLEVAGAPTDNNATLFAKGADSVLDPLYKDGTYTKVNEQRIKKWDPHNAQTYFEQQYQAHSDINAVLVANDDMNNGVITALKNRQVKPKQVPTTGQDATVTGLQNILDGYQCMTVYKPLKAEAQATGKLAISLINGEENPPQINGKVDDGNSQVPAVLLKPISVTTENMADTVIKDGYVKTSELCKGSYAKKCAKAGIK